MALKFHPEPGTILICDYRTGFKVPEMVKRRPVVTVGKCIMAKADWSRRFDDPIPLPDGSIVCTIGEAAAYTADLPKRVGKAPAWQHAAADLTRAARNSADVSRARMSFYKALYGEDEQHTGRARMDSSRTSQR